MLPRYTSSQSKLRKKALCRNFDLRYLRAHMDDARFTSVWTQGQAMTMEQVIDYALERIPEIDERDA